MDQNNQTNTKPNPKTKKIAIVLKKKPNNMYRTKMQLPPSFVGRYQPRTVVQATKYARMFYELIGQKYSESTMFDVTLFTSDEAVWKLLELVISGDLEATTLDTALGYLMMFFKAESLPPPEKLVNLKSKLQTKVKKVHSKKRKQTHQAVDWNGVYEWAKANAAKSKALSHWTRFIIIALYREVPCRAATMVELKWSPTPSGNYIDLKSGKLVANKHKTVKSVGPLEWNLSRQLVADLKSYYSVFTYPYVFIKNVKPYGLPMTSDSFAIQVKRTFEKYQKEHRLPKRTIGIHVIRHDHATNKVEVQAGAGAGAGAGAVIQGLYDAQHLLGHKYADTTLTHYVKNL